MVRHAFHFFICLFLITSRLMAQDSTKINWEEFYPLHPGDFWKYKIEWVETGRIEFETKEVIAETAISNDRIFKKTAHYYHGIRSYNYERVDSLGDVYTYYPAPDKEVLVWRLNISIGEGWWTVDSTSFLKLTDKGLMNPWGDSVIYLVFKQYSFLGGIFWDSSYVGIVQNFGVASRSPGGCSGASEELIGAVIKGKVYGDTTRTSVQIGAEEFLPEAMILYQNYPNPFNHLTKLNYEIPQGGEVTLTIYNLRGEIVKQLINQHQSTGQHEVYWDGKNENGENVASGIYWYQLKTGNLYITKRLLLLRKTKANRRSWGSLSKPSKIGKHPPAFTWYAGMVKTSRGIG